MTSNSARDPFTAIILLHVHDAADIRLVVTIPLFMSHTQLVYLYIYIYTHIIYVYVNCIHTLQSTYMYTYCIHIHKITAIGRFAFEQAYLALVVLTTFSIMVLRPPGFGYWCTTGKNSDSGTLLPSSCWCFTVWQHLQPPLSIIRYVNLQYTDGFELIQGRS